MRETVEQPDGQRRPADEPGQRHKLWCGNSLGALGFLIDMLSYQRAMGACLFYDEEYGELRLLMGRSRPAPSPDSTVPDPMNWPIH